jgi:hypothetical protein
VINVASLNDPVLINKLINQQQKPQASKAKPQQNNKNQSKSKTPDKPAS